MRRPPWTSQAAGQPGADGAAGGPHVAGLEVPGEGRGGPGWSGSVRLHFAVPTLTSSELLVRPPSKDVCGGCCGPGAQPAWACPAGETTPSLDWLVVSLSCPVHTSLSRGRKPPWGGAGRGPSIVLDHQRAWAERPRSLTFPRPRLPSDFSAALFRGLCCSCISQISSLEPGAPPPRPQPRSGYRWPS